MTDPPAAPANGYAARISDLERRITKMEDREIPTNIAVIMERVEGLNTELRAMKHAAFAACGLLIGALGVLIPLLTK